MSQLWRICRTIKHQRLTRSIYLHSSSNKWQGKSSVYVLGCIAMYLFFFLTIYLIVSRASAVLFIFVRDSLLDVVIDK